MSELDNGQAVTFENLIEALQGNGGCFVDYNDTRYYVCYMNCKEDIIVVIDKYGIIKARSKSYYDGERSIEGDTLIFNLVQWYIT